MPPFGSLHLFLLFTVVSVACAAKTCNVLDFDGVADNMTDIAPAITKAYTECVSNAMTSNPGDTVLLVPAGTYALKTQVSFVKAQNFSVEINGDLHLNFDPSLGGNMFLFDRCNHVVWKGNGTIHGHGDLWRPNRDLTKYPGRPRLLRFQNCDNVDVSGVTLNNSPLFHVTIIGDNNVAHDMKIIADNIGETDGFDVSGNNNHVHDVSVENGDECVTVKNPTDGFLAQNIQCFYTGESNWRTVQGCNIGSFGKEEQGVAIQNVYYRNVTQHNGSGGIILKSYPSASGVVKNVTYVDFKFTNVAYPIQISNYWCPHESCPSATGNITWEDITFKRINGTGDSSDRPTIDVKCISGHMCKDITFENVTLSKEKDVKATVHVSNACGNGLSPELQGC